MDERNDQKFPKEATFKKWKDKFPWLKIWSIDHQKKMICEICTDQEEKLKQISHTNLTFVNGSTNFKMSAIAEHGSTDSHKCATEAMEKEQVTIAGKSIPMRKITLEVPADIPISSGLKKMGVKEQQALTKLHDVEYYIPLKRRPFTNFKDPIDLEKLHGVKFQSGAYENETSCRDFIDSISEFLFKDNLPVYKNF